MVSQNLNTTTCVDNSETNQDEVTLAGAARKRLERLEKVKSVKLKAASLAALEHQSASARLTMLEYSGAFGQAQLLREKMANEHASLMRSNPVAFQEDIASQADAKYR